MAIYFIHAEKTNYYKIGYTGRSISSRMASLQTGNPHQLRLVASAETGTLKQESKLLDKWSHRNTRGEWFELTPIDVKEVLNLFSRRRAAALRTTPAQRDRAKENKRLANVFATWSLDDRELYMRHACGELNAWKRAEIEDYAERPMHQLYKRWYVRTTNAEWNALTEEQQLEKKRAMAAQLLVWREGE